MDFCIFLTNYHEFADDRHIIQQDGVLIRNIQESDEGVYRCRARVAMLGSLDLLDIQVEVHSTPKIIEPPQVGNSYSIAFVLLASLCKLDLY